MRHSIHSTRSSGRVAIGRRAFIKAAGAFAGMSCLAPRAVAKNGSTSASRSVDLGLPLLDRIAGLLSSRSDADCISRITVCLRPFRAAGPRIEVEHLGDKLVVHNYGHGGSGWSLSWGSAAQATQLAWQASAGGREFGVVGAGIIGLTSALLLQRSGAKVTIYARELTPNTRSWRATGTWAPDFRVALASAVSANFGSFWERMARDSFAHHQRFCELRGKPVELTDRWYVAGSPQSPETSKAEAAPGAAPRDSDFVQLNQRLADLLPRPIPQRISTNPALQAFRWRSMTFNVTTYCAKLLDEFREAGGRTVVREFHCASELKELAERVIVNCPGYDARSTWGDRSIVPIRGQIAWLAADADFRLGLIYKDLFLLARQDGVLLQSTKDSGNEGWNDANEMPDLAAAEQDVAALRSFSAGYRTMQG
jgi:D-amino-acid oxidase